MGGNGVLRGRGWSSGKLHKCMKNVLKTSNSKLPVAEIRGEGETVKHGGFPLEKVLLRGEKSSPDKSLTLTLFSHSFLSGKRDGTLSNS